MSQYLVHQGQTGYLKTLKRKMKHWELFLTLLKQVQRKKIYINIKYFFIHFFLKTLANFSICCVIWVCDLTRGLKKKFQFAPVLLGFVLTKLSLFRGPMKHFSSIDSAFTHLCVWKKRSLFSVVTNITEKISI